MTTSYTVPDDPKMLRETLCVAQGLVLRAPDDGRKREHGDRLQRLINECDRHRSIGTDGKHGDRHTITCGCDDMPDRYRPTQITPAIQRTSQTLWEELAPFMAADLEAVAVARRVLAAALDVEEMARVLDLHASFKASSEIQDPNTPWYWECDGCDARLVRGGTYGRADVIAALATHQATELSTVILGAL